MANVTCKRCGGEARWETRKDGSYYLAIPIRDGDRYAIGARKRPHSCAAVRDSRERDLRYAKERAEVLRHGISGGRELLDDSNVDADLMKAIVAHGATERMVEAWAVELEAVEARIGRIEADIARYAYTPAA